MAASSIELLRAKHGDTVVEQMKLIWTQDALHGAKKDMVRHFLGRRETSPQPPNVLVHEDVTAEHLFEMICKMVLIAPQDWYEIATGAKLPVDVKNDFSCIGVAFDASSRLRRAGIEFYHNVASDRQTRQAVNDPQGSYAFYVTKKGNSHGVDLYLAENLPVKVAGAIRVVMVSDTHVLHRRLKLPHGDLLVHAGDLSYEEQRSLDGKRFDEYVASNPFDASDFREFVEWFKNTSNLGLADTFEWLSNSRFEKCVVVGGNHDHILETLAKHGKAGQLCNAYGLQYLDTKHKPTHLRCGGRQVRVWGSPVSTAAGLDGTRAVVSANCAFMFDVNKGQEFLKECEHVAEGSLDIMVTHTPPEGMLLGKKGKTFDAINELIRRVKPSLYVCGHAHNGDDLFQGRCADIEGGGVGINAACLSNWNYLHGLPVVYDLQVPGERPVDCSTGCHIL